MPNPPTAPATTSCRSGSTAASTYAQPKDSAPCTGAPAANSTQVRSSRGSRTFPSAHPPSATSPPSSSVHTVDGNPDTTAPATPATSACEERRTARRLRFRACPG